MKRSNKAGPVRLKTYICAMWGNAGEEKAVCGEEGPVRRRWWWT
jgi:hypothetical protein